MQALQAHQGESFGNWYGIAPQLVFLLLHH
jgi:hypothetical protein